MPAPTPCALTHRRPRRPDRLAHVLVLAAITVAVAAGVSDVPEPAHAASHPPVDSAGGIVAADNTLASGVGAEILAAGGTAADAAVGVATTLGLVQPFSSGLGGGGFCLYYDAAASDVLVYDFRETAPAAAHGDMYLDSEGNPQPKLSVRGGLAVGTPGELRGLHALHSAHGKRPFSANLTPTIALARHGFPAGSLLVERLDKYGDDLADRAPGMTSWLMPDGDVPTEGTKLRNEALADLLTAVAEEGPDAFYRGDSARAIAEAVQGQGGILTAEDVEGYEIVVREPVHGEYRGLQVYSMPPPSSGGIAVVEILNILEGFDMSGLPRGSSRHLHHLAEAFKFAFADRANFLGDPDFVEVPRERLTSAEYAAELRAMIKPDGVLETDAYGPLRYAPDDSGTSHFSIVDEDGNAASCTTTINTSFGSMVYVESLGIVLNNEMDDFVQKPGVPNTYGLVGTEANAVAPGKRPLSSMSPTLVLDEDGVVFVLGASGGPTIITAVVQVLVNGIDLGLTIREAVEDPRIHHQWLPNMLFAEPEIPEDVVDALGERGQKVITRPGFSAVQAVHVDDDGHRYAASDPRKHGMPVAVPEPPQPGADTGPTADEPSRSTSAPTPEREAAPTP